MSFYSQSLIEKYYIKTQKTSRENFFATSIESRVIIKRHVFLSKNLTLKLNNLKNNTIFKKCYLNKLFKN